MCFGICSYYLVKLSAKVQQLHPKHLVNHVNYLANHVLRRVFAKFITLYSSFALNSLGQHPSIIRNAFESEPGSEKPQTADT